MNIMRDLLDRFPARTELGENEYKGEDGLIYCSKCHTPVQCRVTVESVEHIFPCTCKCSREENVNAGCTFSV